MLPLPVLPPAPLVGQNVAPIRLAVDATRGGQGVFRVVETVAVRPGKRAFYFPRFIPGEHWGSGPINEMLGLTFSANGSTLEWTRDSVDLFKFSVVVPPNAREVTISFTNAGEIGDVSAPNLARIKWNRLLLYPEGPTTDRMMIAPELTVPEGWAIATALVQTGHTGSTARYRPVSVTELVDSPAQAGRYARSYPVGEIAGAPVRLAVMADAAGFENLPEATVERSRRLVAESAAIFGGRHFRQYDFLITLSDSGAGDGLEHHESSEDGSGLRAGGSIGGLLAHEFAHSWNGKYRRPAGLATPEFHTPMQGDLLWVYEGLTQYLGAVLAARSGFTTPEGFRLGFARSAQSYDASPGRAWRTVDDTARSVGLLRNPPTSYGRERRGLDYYGEASLVWLEADLLIRDESGGKRSLDDFLRGFFGGVSDAPVVRPYAFEDVVRGLNAVHRHDWAGFLRDRIGRIRKTKIVDAIARGGYSVGSSAAPVASTPARRGTAAGFALPSLGMTLAADGTVSTVALDGPAFLAGLVVGAKITQVNGQPFTRALLEEPATKPGAGRLALTVVARGETKPVEVVFEGAAPSGVTVQAIPGRAPLLDAIGKPIAP